MSFKNAIIIMTSNLGSKEIYKATAGQDNFGSLAQNETIKSLVMDQVCGGGEGGKGGEVCVHQVCLG